MGIVPEFVAEIEGKQHAGIHAQYREPLGLDG
jgi:hypothetical protein